MAEANYDQYHGDILETQSPSFTIEQVENIASRKYRQAALWAHWKPGSTRQ
jgi:hypothetical protein